MRQYEGATIPAICHDCGREYLISKPEHDTPDAVCPECFDAFDGMSIEELCSTSKVGVEALSPFPQLGDGYYDNEGNWQRTKFCFGSCGHLCTCGPPGNLYYSVAHDKRTPLPALLNAGDCDVK